MSYNLGYSLYINIQFFYLLNVYDHLKAAILSLPSIIIFVATIKVSNKIIENTVSDPNRFDNRQKGSIIGIVFTLGIVIVNKIFFNGSFNIIVITVIMFYSFALYRSFKLSKFFYKEIYEKKPAKTIEEIMIFKDKELMSFAKMLIMFILPFISFHMGYYKILSIDNVWSVNNYEAVLNEDQRQKIVRILESGILVELPNGTFNFIFNDNRKTIIFKDDIEKKQLLEKKGFNFLDWIK